MIELAEIHLALNTGYITCQIVLKVVNGQFGMWLAYPQDKWRYTGSPLRGNARQYSWSHPPKSNALVSQRLRETAVNI